MPDLLLFALEQSEKGIPTPPPAQSKPLLPTPAEMIERLSQVVIGHEEAKKILATAVYNHLLRCAMEDLEEARTAPENHVWIVGPSGSGKTLLLDTLSRMAGIPVMHIDCSNLTPHGYRGTNISNHLHALSSDLVEDNRTHPAIIVLDEGDKLADTRNEAGTYRAMIQRNLLQVLGGSACGHSLDINGSRLLVILIGSFPELDKIRDKARVPVIGFAAEQRGLIAHPDNLPALRPEDLVEYGFSAEFVGRFSNFVSLDPIDEATMRRILTDASNNPLARRCEFFALHGVRLTYTDTAIAEIARIAATHPTGARALREVIDRTLRGIQHDLADLNAMGVTEIVVNEDVVRGLKPPAEIKGPVVPGNDRLIRIREHAAMYRQKVISPRLGDDD